MEEEKNGIFFKMLIQKVMMHTFNNELDEMKRLSTNIEDFNRVGQQRLDSHTLHYHEERDGKQWQAKGGLPKLPSKKKWLCHCIRPK